jgi:hypothetical protein
MQLSPEFLAFVLWTQPTLKFLRPLLDCYLPHNARFLLTLYMWIAIIPIESR